MYFKTYLVVLVQNFGVFAEVKNLKFEPIDRKRVSETNKES